MKLLVLSCLSSHLSNHSVQTTRLISIQCGDKPTLTFSSVTLIWVQFGSFLWTSLKGLNEPACLQIDYGTT
jgi:hypothetical protein